MKKKEAFLLFIFIVYLIYLFFLFFSPTQFINIQQEIKWTKKVGALFNYIPYLKGISLRLTNNFILLSVFFFMTGSIYEKKKSGFFIIFIIISIILYLFVFKINLIFTSTYRATKFFSTFLTIFSFLFFAHDKNDKIKVIPIFFIFISLFYCFFSPNIPLSGIFVSFFVGLLF